MKTNSQSIAILSILLVFGSLKLAISNEFSAAQTGLSLDGQGKEQTSLPQHDQEKTSADHDGQSVRLKTGAAFDQASNQRITETWTDWPIRKVLSNLTQRYRVAIFLDRRVDPDLKLRRNPEKLPLKMALYLAANDHQLGIAQIGSVWYVGPVKSAANLRQLRDDINHKVEFLNVNAKSRWSRLSTLQWDRLANPKAIIRSVIRTSKLDSPQLASDGQNPIDRIPFDLWPQNHLPPLSPTDQLILMLVGFDLAPNLTSREGQYEIVPFKHYERITLSIHRSIPSKLLREIEDRYQNLQIRKKGSEKTFEGAPIDVYHARWNTMVFTRRESSKNEKVVGTLENTTASRGAILKKIASTLKIEFTFQPEHNEILRQRVTINLVRVPYSQIVAEVLKGTNLKGELTDDALIISEID